MILCENQAYYTGWTKNISERFQKHKNGNGSRYTKLNRPIKVVYWKTCKDKSFAMKTEIGIKKLTRKQKERLIFGWREEMNLPEEFDQYEYLSIAPGRVNILGEHIDYNGGSVLPAAIDRYVFLGANKRTDQMIKITALDLKDTITFRINNIEKKIDIHGNPLPDWALYPAGVFWAAKKQNLELSGFEGIFVSSIPMGAGLSSSAAVEVAFAALMREFCSWDMDNMELAKMCQYAENQYIGVNCGLMDQFASANGIKNAFLFFNTTNLDWYPVEIPDTISIVITNSKIPRSLATSAYNDRRVSCEQALLKFQNKFPDIQNLCELSLSEFEEVQKSIDDTLQKRSKHVVEECARVNQAIDLLKDNQLNEFGNLMKASHNSLRDLYEVSTPELDDLVSIASGLQGCYGSRLTGAGFGGCIVSLVEKKAVSAFVSALASSYRAKTGKEIETYVCTASDGVTVQWCEKNSSK